MEEIKSIDNGLVKFSNYEYQGIRVPRVTSVISAMINNESLIKWANNLGFKHINCRDVLNEASDLGTRTHQRIEQILNGSDYNYNGEITTVQSFINWFRIIQENTNYRVIFTEKTIVTPLFGGTLDCLMEINGAKYLIDYKTSNYVAYRYFLQLAAYRKMLREVEKIDVDGVIILHLDKDVPCFEEYVMNIPQYLPLLNHYELTFDFLVQGYINLLICEREFKDYLKERTKEE